MWIVSISVSPFDNTQTLKFKTQLTIAFFAVFIILLLSNDEILRLDKNNLNICDVTLYHSIERRSNRNCLSLLVPCTVELRDDSEGGVGNIANELIKQGLVMAIEQVQCTPYL